MNRKSYGVIFSLTLATIRAIKEVFPEAKPVAKIFVRYESNADFNFYHGSIERFVFPALIGMDTEQGLSKIDNIIFMDPITKEVIFTFEKAAA